MVKINKSILVWFFMIVLVSSIAFAIESDLVSRYSLNDSNQYGNVTVSGGVFDSFGSNNGTYFGRTFNHGVNTGATYNNITGVITGATWSEDCVRGSCLEFDGDGDYVAISSFEEIKEEITMSAWFYAEDNIFDSYSNIIGANTADAFFIRTADGEKRLYNRIKTSSGSVTQNIYPNLGQWNNVVVTYDGSNMKSYVNNVLVDTDIQTGDIIDTDGIVYIAKNGGQYFNGSIDEVQIFSEALDETQINELYTNGKLDHARPSETSFRMDEGTGSEVYSSGQMGTSLEFDGVSDYVQTGDIDIDEGTVCSWIKLNANISDYSTDLDIIYKELQFYLRLDADGTNKLQFVVWDSVTTPNIRGSKTDWLKDTWYHVCGRSDGTNLNVFVDGVQDGGDGAYTAPLDSSTWKLLIGDNEGHTKEFNGSIDEVVIYNRSLSDTEILELYNSGIPVNNNGLVAYYDFNEKTGSDVYDNNHLIEGRLNTNPSNRAFSFDGVDDYVTLTNESNFDVDNVTISAWINAKSFVHNGGIFNKWSSDGYMLTTKATGGNGISFYDSSDALGSLGVLSTDTWYHVVARADGINKSIWIDGVKNAEKPIATWVNNNDIPTIGKYLSAYFNGTIDDMRIYNRSLTEQEIRAIYDENSHLRNFTSYTPTNLSLDVYEGDQIEFTATSTIDSGIQWFLNGVYQSIGNAWTWFVGVHDADNYNEIIAYAENDTTGEYGHVMWSGITKDRFPLVPSSISPTRGVYDSNIPMTCFINDSSTWFHNSTFDFDVYYDNGSGAVWHNVASNHTKGIYRFNTLSVPEQTGVKVRCRSFDGLYLSNYSSVDTDLAISHKDFKLETFDVSPSARRTIMSDQFFGTHCKINLPNTRYRIKNIYADCDNDGLWDGTTSYESDQYINEDVLYNKCDYARAGLKTLTSGCIVEKINESESWSIPFCAKLPIDDDLCNIVNTYKFEVFEAWER